MIARSIMPVKKTSPHIERRACIKFESVGMRVWEGDNGGISTDGVLIAAPFTVERAGWRETRAGKEKEKLSEGHSVGAEASEDEGRRGEWTVRGRRGTAGRPDSKWLSIKVSPPVRTTAGPMAGLTNGSRNLHSLRSIRLPILPESRIRLFVRCSFYHELHGRNKKKKERKKEKRRKVREKKRVG